MAKRRIKWSPDAIEDLKSILEYFNNRNKSKKYSKKLYAQIQNDLTQLIDNPSIGKETDINEITCIISSNYELIYKTFDESILVIMIWDCRRNPEKKAISKRL